MADRFSGYRLLLKRIGDVPAPARWGLVCKHLLGIDRQSASRLWKNLPVYLPLPLMTPSDQENAVRQLERGGISHEFTVLTGASLESCSRHPRVGIDQVCPGCGELRACTLCLKAEVPGQCAVCARRAQRRRRFRNLRVGALFVVFLLVGLGTLSQDRRISRWGSPLSVAIYPVRGDSGEEVAEYTSALSSSSYQPLVDFLNREGHRYGVEASPVIDVRLGTAISDLPPDAPEPTASWREIAWWSLRLRYWALRTRWVHDLPKADVTLFVVYYRPTMGTTLEHSLGLAKGHIGIVHVFAGRKQAAQAQVAIAHELMHAVGASDKYTGEGQPVFPEGYGDPEQVPRYPQTRAEIMAGTLALSPSESRLVSSLNQCVVGELTAREVHWVRGGEE